MTNEWIEDKELKDHWEKVHHDGYRAKVRPVSSGGQGSNLPQASEQAAQTLERARAGHRVVQVFGPDGHRAGESLITPEQDFRSFADAYLDTFRPNLKM
jgi:hypothetical protein